VQRESGYLDILRSKGDDTLEAKLDLGPEFDQQTCEEFLKLVGIRGLTAAEHVDHDTAESFRIPPAAITRIEKAWLATWELVSENLAKPDVVPSDALDRSRELFLAYETEIAAALLLAGLPEAYAAKDGVRVLAVTNQLGSDPKRRVRATAQWLLSVLAPVGDIKEAWSPAGTSFRAVVGLRLFHQLVRRALTLKREDPEHGGPALDKFLGPANQTPINQEDLIGTRLTFSIGVFEVLERFGIAWSENDQTSYLKAWNFIGYCLGIVDTWPRLNGDDGSGLPVKSPCPASVADSRMLLDLIRCHQWPDPETPWSPYLRTNGAPGAVDVKLTDELMELQPGRELVNALLAELVDGMLPATRRWPRALMQVLCPHQVQDRLGLGAPGLPLSSLDQLPPLTRRIGQFTRIYQRNPVSGATLRFMANEVARRAVVSFVDAKRHAPFVLPGLEAWSSGIRPS
jgi:hypothetical protein